MKKIIISIVGWIMIFYGVLFINSQMVSINNAITLIVRFIDRNIAELALVIATVGVITIQMMIRPKKEKKEVK